MRIEIIGKWRSYEGCADAYTSRCADVMVSHHPIKDYFLNNCTVHSAFAYML